MEVRDFVRAFNRLTSGVVPRGTRLSYAKAHRSASIFLKNIASPSVKLDA